MLWFNYSLIKYMPNVKRGEIINLGIVVFRDSGIDLRMLKNPGKVRIFDDRTELADLDNFHSVFLNVSKFAQSADEQYEMLKMFRGSVYITDPGSFSIPDLSAYEKTVCELYDCLVKPFSLKERATKQYRLQTKLKQKFQALEILATEPDQINEHKVVPNFAVGLDTGFTADFMLKNGKYHMTGVVDFNLSDAPNKFRETTLKMMTFVEGSKILGNPAKYFVYSATPSKEHEMRTHLRLAEEYSDMMFNFESNQDQSKYLGLIRDFANQIPRLNLHD